MAGYRVIALQEAESVESVEGMHWVPVRRALGVGAFGVNAFRADRAGDPVVEEHEESPGQEELYVVVRGSATFTIAGEEVDAPHGTAVFVPDPGALRSAVAAEDETVVLAVGGWRDRPYHPLPWEPIYLAAEQIRDRDWAGAAATIEREAGDLLESWPVRYRLATLYARMDDGDRALENLRLAIAANPVAAERAQEDEAFRQLRGDPDWPGRNG